MNKSKNSRISTSKNVLNSVLEANNGNPNIETKGVAYTAFPRPPNLYSGTTFKWENLTTGHDGDLVTGCQPDNHIQIEFEARLLLKCIYVRPPSVKGFDEKRLNRGQLLIQSHRDGPFEKFLEIEGCKPGFDKKIEIDQWLCAIRFMRGHGIPSGNCMGLGRLVCIGYRQDDIFRFVRDRRGIDVGFRFL